MSNNTEFSNKKYINLETYKKNGSAVRTPVLFLYYNNMLYFRTEVRSWKLKRIKNNPHVKFALCNVKGKVLSEWREGEAFEEQHNFEVIDSLLDKKYGFRAILLKIMYKIRNIKFTIVSIQLNKQ